MNADDDDDAASAPKAIDGKRNKKKKPKNGGGNLGRPIVMEEQIWVYHPEDDYVETVRSICHFPGFSLV